MLPTSLPIHHVGDGNRSVAYIADYLSSGASTSVSFTRPADNAPYTAGDAVGAASAILTFAGLGVACTPGRNIIITAVVNYTVGISDVRLLVTLR